MPTGSVIIWPDVAAVAAAVDATAVTMSTPGYAKLCDASNGTPFSLSSTYRTSFEYVFAISAPGLAYPTIGDEWMTLDVFPDPLPALVDSGDLFFVSDADQSGSLSCWCQAIFKVVRSGSGGYPFSLVKCSDREDPQLDCCQSLFVPAIGDDLDRSQHFIPAAWAAYYNEGVTDTAGQGIIDRVQDKCALGGGGITFKFQHDTGAATHYDLIEARRSMSGYFTWPIRRKWMAAIKTNIETIIARTNNCGSKGPDPVTGITALRGCALTFEDLQNALAYEGLGNQPGCMTDVNLMPWEGDTCTDSSGDAAMQACGSLGVFKATLLQLTEMLRIIVADVRPAGDGCGSGCDSDSPAGACCPDGADFFGGGPGNPFNGCEDGSHILVAAGDGASTNPFCYEDPATKLHRKSCWYCSTCDAQYGTGWSCHNPHGFSCGDQDCPGGYVYLPQGCINASDGKCPCSDGGCVPCNYETHPCTDGSTPTTAGCTAPQVAHLGSGGEGPACCQLCACDDTTSVKTLQLDIAWPTNPISAPFSTVTMPLAIGDPCSWSGTHTFNNGLASSDPFYCEITISATLSVTVAGSSTEDWTYDLTVNYGTFASHRYPASEQGPDGQYFINGHDPIDTGVTCYAPA